VYDGHVAQLAQAVTADFLAQGHFTAHLRLMRQLYRSRRDLLLNLIQKRLPWARPLSIVGGLQLSIALPQNTEAYMTRKAAERGIATPSFSSLHIGTPKNEGWLLGFAALQPGQISDAVEALSKIRLPKTTSV
jgi:GntR family transcriptional regulator/MocR family aminotransferase